MMTLTKDPLHVNFSTKKEENEQVKMWYIMYFPRI